MLIPLQVIEVSGARRSSRDRQATPFFKERRCAFAYKQKNQPSYPGLSVERCLSHLLLYTPSCHSTIGFLINCWFRCITLNAQSCPQLLLLAVGEFLRISSDSFRRTTSQRKRGVSSSTMPLAHRPWFSCSAPVSVSHPEKVLLKAHG